MPDTQPQLRKAAIVIDSLDNAAADALLAQLAPEMAARVRQVRLQLGAVDPLERERIIEEFLHLGAAPANPAPADVEVDESLAAKIAVASDCSADLPSGESPAPAPFEFLQQASAEQLAEWFAAEHPQTISLVLSHLSACRAAEVLRRLPEDLQPEVLHRLARLDEADAEVVAEIERELERSWFGRGRPHGHRSAGSAAVEAILAAGAREQRPVWLQALEKRDPQLARELGYLPASPGPRRAATAYLDEDAEPLLWRDHVVPRPIPEAAAGPLPSAAAPACTTESSAAAETPASGGDIAFDDLLALADDSLAKVFRAAEPPVALLALTGASPALADRILRRLSAAEARQLEREMERLGAIRLQDVELAQRQVAAVARQLAQAGSIPAPPTRAVPAAA